MQRPIPNSRQSLRNQMEEGQKPCWSQMVKVPWSHGQGHHKETYRINEPGYVGAHRDRTSNQGACIGLALCTYVTVVQLLSHIKI